jgi:hypothetical protein
MTFLLLLHFLLHPLLPLHLQDYITYDRGRSLEHYEHAETTHIMFAFLSASVKCSSQEQFLIIVSGLRFFLSLVARCSSLQKKEMDVGEEKRTSKQEKTNADIS